jgi:hypothetical protein
MQNPPINVRYPVSRSSMPYNSQTLDPFYAQQTESVTQQPGSAVPQQYINYVQPGSDVVFLTGATSQLTHITLQPGVNVYYGSQTKNTFDPNDIKLSDGTLLALFSNNPNLAADNFMACANYPNSNGYLHQFRTKKDIPYIQLVSSASMNEPMSLIQMDQNFCQRGDNPRLNGFAYPIKRETGLSTAITYDYIIGLCNPNEFLEYISTSLCVGLYKLSDPININK